MSNKLSTNNTLAGRKKSPRLLISSSLFLLILMGMTFSLHSIQAEDNINKVIKPEPVVKPLVNFTPGTSSEILLNPGKGWVVYGLPDNQSAATMALATTGYMRFYWTDIEPDEGNYNWQAIDDYMNAWKAVGKKFAFGIMNMDTYSDSRYVTPRWVFDAGADYWTYNVTDSSQGTPGPKIIPIWSDSVFKSKVRDFVTALGQRYNGNPNIAYVDVRSYGNWGEQHNYPYGGTELSSSDLKLMLQWYQSAFNRTPVVVPWGKSGYNTIYDWAVGQGMGMRRDGVLVDSNGSEVARAAGHGPGVFEFYSSYQQLRDDGQWSNKNLVDAVHIGKASYVGMGQWDNDAQVFLSQQGSTIRSLANVIGYYFVLKQAQYSAGRGIGTTSTLNLTWLNQGVSPIGISSKVGLALLDDKNVVKARVWLNYDPKTWQPGVQLLQPTTFTFGAQPAGHYRLAIGLFENTSQTNPTIKLGISGGTSQNWYPISTAFNYSSKSGISQYAGSTEDDDGRYILDAVDNPDNANYTQEWHKR